MTSSGKQAFSLDDLDDEPVEISIVETGVPCMGFEGPCPSMDATRRRQNTRYADDSMNWVVLCPECMRMCDEYWAEMWADYYANCL